MTVIRVILSALHALLQLAGSVLVAGLSFLLVGLGAVAVRIALISSWFGLGGFGFLRRRRNKG